MNEYYKDDDIIIYFSHLPRVDVRYVTPWINEDEIKDIKNKPFECENGFKVIVEDLKNNQMYNFEIAKGYCWDGASIPRAFWRLIGSKTDSSFLIASCVHDYMCENHECVGKNRNLSSKIFRGLLIATGVSKMKAQTMYLAVDNFQKFCGWN